ncbi:MAG: hypothetical protein UY41_C0058G0002 [Candidatus Moranbacteria bacterium GW2011_GWE1_49_15]|nr:MAG: hypothetical protein UY41_C0058G0002 [Candidatus Moranbacteria bacterium GW2011_GWE1_49_15]
MTPAVRKQVSEGIQRQLRAAEAKAKDDFTLILIRTRVRSAEKRVADETFGKCTIDNKTINLGVLQKDPSQPYCEECERRIAKIHKWLLKKLSESRKELDGITATTRSILKNDSAKTIGKEGDIVLPDVDVPNIRSGRLKQEIRQMEESLISMAKGEYDGACESCEEPIPEGRLKIFPGTKKCTTCAGGTKKERD